MVTGNQSKIGGGDGGKDLVWILAIKIVLPSFGKTH